MSDEVPNREVATEIAKEYADSECIGELGEVTDTEERDTEWVVEFQTHTFSDSYSHRVRITKSAGNVISHDRSTRFGDLE